MSSFDCPHCGAGYGTDQVAPGTTFTCGACNETVTAPATTTAPPPAASAPMSSAPQRRAPARKAAPRAKSGGPNKGIIIGGAVVAVAAVIGLAMALTGNGDQDGGGEPEPKTDPLAPAHEFTSEVEARHDLNAPQGAWDAMLELENRASEWRQAGKPTVAVRSLTSKAAELRANVLNLDADFAPARERRGERKYTDDLLPFTEAEYLQSVDRILAQQAHDKIKRLTKTGQGWGKKPLFEGVDALLTRLVPLRAAREALENSPFGKAAKALEKPTIAELEKRLAKGDDGASWPGADVRIKKPFVFFIQKDAGWDPQDVANDRGAELLALQDIIMAEFADDLGLTPVDEPVPVLMFHSRKMYEKYRGPGMAEAHFEPGTGRMAVHDNCRRDTIMHEGTHQLFWFWTSKNAESRMNPLTRSYWFQEGIAEWYSGAQRARSADNSGWEYEIGHLHLSRMANLGSLMSKGQSKNLFNLKELLQLRKFHEPKLKKTPMRVAAVYAQGWFVIYFMNHYLVDEKGNPIVGENGKYADKWRQYVKAELKGRTGLKVFREIMGTDDAALREMEDEYWRYAKWINKKILLGGIKGRRLIPYTDQIKRGEVVGRPRDDIMPEVDPDERPPMDRDTIGK
ncbi:MAG: DUF1570 domain-containing protein [Planctomycetes bacterium]|nr:DUF1570 domain-containing protein [Planctomycetota bacterium]